MATIRLLLAKSVVAALCVFALLSVAALPARADVADGIKAFETGDYKTALTHFREAGDDVEAKFHLGLMHEDGKGVRKNYIRAWLRFQEAAKKDHTEALFRLGTFNERGIGVPLDFAEAAKLYAKAAEKGHVESQARLGRMTLKGIGVPRDDYEAARWLQKAAERGHARSQGVLDDMHRRGMLNANQILFGVDAGGKGPPDLSEKGKMVKQDMDLMLKLLLIPAPVASPFSMGTTVSMGGELTVIERQDDFMVVLPLVKITGPDGTNGDLGTVRVIVKPEPEGFYRFSTILPGRIVTRSGDGRILTTLTFETFRFEGLWSKALFTALNMDLALTDLKTTVAGGRDAMAVDEIVLKYDLTEKKPGEWSGPTKFSAKGLSVFAGGPDEVLSLDRFSVNGGVEGFRIAEYQAFLSGLGFDVRTGIWNPVKIKEGFTVPQDIPPFVNSAWGELVIRDLQANEPGGKPVFSLDRGTMGLGTRDLNKTLGAFDLKTGYKGLAIEKATANKDLIPQSVSIDFAVEKLPVRKLAAAGFGVLTRLAANFAMVSEVPGRDAMDKLLATMREEAETSLFDAGTEMSLNGIKAHAEAYDIDAQGYVKADRTAVRKISGGGTVNVHGLARLTEDPKAIAMAGNAAQALAILRAFGEEEKDGDRSLTKFRIDVTPEGPVLLNGKDIKTILGTLQPH
jgi:hypothetical protein